MRRRMRRRRRRRSIRGILRALLCASRGPGMLPPTRDKAAPCRGCLLPSCNPSAVGAEVAPGTLSLMTTRDVEGGGGDAHKSKQINRINIVKSVLFYSTIYILCRLVT